MISEEQFREISQKLDTITKLLAGYLVRDAESITQKVEILTALGISTKDTAVFAGTTEGSVETMKKRLRKKVKSSKAKKSGGKLSGENKS